MKLPTVHGVINRRILVNYVAEPAIVAPILPPPFRPKLYKGKAIVGICLIRFKALRPKGFPTFLGINSENGAHRIAVEWEENGVVKEGVYIPRRDTNLKLNAWIGGRLFPGKHYYAQFNVKEVEQTYHLDFKSQDDATISIDAELTDQLDENSWFESLEAVSFFFEQGAVGYSPNGNRLEGLKLIPYEWKVQPLKVTHVHSSFFEDPTVFPEGSIQFDHAILMENIAHEWKALDSIACVSH